jgi:hypothetical protein
MFSRKIAPLKTFSEISLRAKLKIWGSERNIGGSEEKNYLLCTIFV